MGMRMPAGEIVAATIVFVAALSLSVSAMVLCFCRMLAAAAYERIPAALGWLALLALSLAAALIATAVFREVVLTAVLAAG